MPIPLADRIARAAAATLALLERTRAPAASALLAVLLLALALVGVLRPFDAALLVTADALYPIHILDFPLLEYRPPPPNRLFPDVAAHALVAAFVTDPLTQKIVAGTLLFAATALVVGLAKGLAVFALVLAILAARGFGFFDTAMHYSLPLIAVLVQLAQGRRAVQGALIALGVFTNPLIFMALAPLLVDRRERALLPERLAVVVLALAANTIYSEFSPTVVQIAVVFPAWLAAFLLAERLGLREAAALAAIVALPLAALAGLAPARYALPVAASLLILVTPVRRFAFDWRYVAAPAALAAIFLATLDTTRASRLAAAYDCLVEALRARDVAVVASEHWTSKPLDLAARAAGSPLVVKQMDFAQSQSDLWMAPYAFIGEPTPWAVRNVANCARIADDPKHCAHARTAPVVGREQVCGGAFELYRYATPVPRHFAGPPAGKLASAWRHFVGYAEEAWVRVAARLERAGGPRS